MALAIRIIHEGVLSLKNLFQKYRSIHHYNRNQDKN
ncbi:hypothetical protein ME1_00988 [Bartonella vinsonii subsp. arupensis OK-94-513]|uniref:Uncharacterized protein n=1 Tax=Bartonella vinsonii subsp. arupensis OK-94-513 TaxID=1094562 RepID=J0ZHZ5_BARVI|nr:hypothetical protein ME1_00988 [Bartonella vinsonii subsp. arupensis OK-94-513]